MITKFIDKKSVDSTSTAESELCSAVELIKALMMFRLMLEEAQYKQLYPTEVFEDNSATISFAELYQVLGEQ